MKQENKKTLIQKAVETAFLTMDSDELSELKKRALEHDDENFHPKKQNNANDTKKEGDK